MAKRLFYVCAAILCLAAAYHLGAQKAQSAPQPAPTSNPFVAITIHPQSPSRMYVITAAGDFYDSGDNGMTWVYRSNAKGNPGPTGY